MTPIDLKKLRELAEKATKGPWINGGDDWPFIYQTNHITRDIWTIAELGNHYGMNTGKKVDEDAEFIAASNPTTILQLLDELQDYREALEWYAKGNGKYTDDYNLKQPKGTGGSGISQNWGKLARTILGKYKRDE